MKSGKFIKIQDGVIIRRERLEGYHKDKYDPNGCHYYVAMYNKRKKRYDMFPTSHYIDPAKTADLRNKRAILMRIKGAPGLSTVYRVARTKNIHGQPFRSDDFPKEYVGQLNIFQQAKLRRFAKTKGKK